MPVVYPSVDINVRLAALSQEEPYGEDGGGQSERGCVGARAQRNLLNAFPSCTYVKSTVELLEGAIQKLSALEWTM